MDNSKKDKIIIVNIRDSNYLETIYPDFDRSYKTQNADIRSYKKAIEYLLDRGYKIIRCGLYHRDSINISNKKLIIQISGIATIDFLNIIYQKINNKCYFNFFIYT